MSDLSLYAVDEKGSKLAGAVLEPFFKTVYPAFLNHAHTITVTAHLAKRQTGAISIGYCVGNETVPLVPAEGFHPFIASSRIRIICQLSLAPGTGAQAGKMRVQFGAHRLAINVDIVVENELETMHLRPVWDSLA